MFVLDLSHLGVISVSGPTKVGDDEFWTVDASDGTTTWTLAETPTHSEAVSLQRKVFNSLATGEKALNLNAGRKTSQE